MSHLPEHELRRAFFRKLCVHRRASWMALACNDGRRSTVLTRPMDASLYACLFPFSLPLTNSSRRARTPVIHPPRYSPPCSSSTLLFIHPVIHTSRYSSDPVYVHVVFIHKTGSQSRPRCYMRLHVRTLRITHRSVSLFLRCYRRSYSVQCSMYHCQLSINWPLC